MASTAAKHYTFDELLTVVREDFPALRFSTGEAYCWSPATRQIFYKASVDTMSDCWSLLHEIGHGQLQHTHYRLDFELVELEVAAWEKAREIAKQYGIHIDEDHIQDCLDTYRDWLFGRSVCPTCDTKTLQHDDRPQYECFNCHTSWRVSPRRFCRPYRRSQATRNADLPVFNAIDNI